MVSNSSRKSRFRTLASIRTDKAKKFLLQLANLDEEAVPRFKRRFGDLFFPEVPALLIQNWAIRVEEEDVVDLSADEKLWKYWLLPLRDSVRRLWISDERDKRWGTFRILEKYFLIGSSRLAEGPVKDDVEWFLPPNLGPETTCEQIFTYMTGRTSRCQNASCHTPYFFAIRRSQKYCSDVCAIPAQREFKRKWWAENGPEWRHKRAGPIKNQNKRANRESPNRGRSVRHLP